MKTRVRIALVTAGLIAIVVFVQIHSGRYIYLTADYPAGVRFIAADDAGNVSCVAAAWNRDPVHPAMCPIALHLPDGDLGASDFEPPRMLLFRGFSIARSDEVASISRSDRALDRPHDDWRTIDIHQAAQSCYTNMHKDRRANEERKYFFFEKKKQKTFALCTKPTVQMGKSGAALDR
jgi:hypothetical protein